MTGMNEIIAPYKPLTWQIEPWYSKVLILLITGSAGGGKSRFAGEKIHGFMKKYPGATGLMLRKAREYASKSIVPFMAHTVIGNDPNVVMKKGATLFQYSNNSTLYWGGMKDDNQREGLRSIGKDGSLDIVWVEEANAFTRLDFNELLARMRGSATDWVQIILTTNPDVPTHWIYQDLILGGDASVFYSSASDNTYNPPSYFVALSKLTGVLKQRLVEGKWVQAEGAVYDEYDAAIHLIEPFEIPEDWKRMCSIDFGYTNPFVCQWWALDNDGRMYRYRELYKSQMLVEDAADEIKRLEANFTREKWNEVSNDEKEQAWRAGEKISVRVADHDAEDRATLQRYGISTIPAKKAVSVGIQAVKSRLQLAGDGKPRIYFMRGALVEEDQHMKDQRKPVCTEEEIVGYVWHKTKENRPVKEEPVKDNDHGCDTMRYGVMNYENKGIQVIDNPFYQ